MKSLSTRVPDDTYARLEERAEERNTSVSAEARKLIAQGFDVEELELELDDLRDRLDARETRVETLEAQLAERSEIEDKIEDLPDKIRETGTYAERRQRLLDEATLVERLRWKVTGVPVDRVESDDEPKNRTT